MVTRLSVAGTDGIGNWLLMDANDIERVERNKHTDEARRQRQAAHEAYRDAKQRAREEVIRQTAERRRQKETLQLERQRAKAAEEAESARAEEQRGARKRRLRRWRQWRYRLGTIGPILILKRGLRR